MPHPKNQPPLIPQFPLTVFLNIPGNFENPVKQTSVRPNRAGCANLVFPAALTTPRPLQIIPAVASVSRVGEPGAFVRSTSSPAVISTIQSRSAPAGQRNGDRAIAVWASERRPVNHVGRDCYFGFPAWPLCRRIIHTRSRITPAVTACITLMSNNSTGPAR